METYFPSMNNKAESQVARERVMQDMQALVRDAESLLKLTADDVSEKAVETRHRVAAALERAKQSCAELQEKGIESAKEAVRKADDTIRAHPYESIGIALGIGILLGALIRRN